VARVRVRGWGVEHVSRTRARMSVLGGCTKTGVAQASSLQTSRRGRRRYGLPRSQAPAWDRSCSQLCCLSSLRPLRPHSRPVAPQRGKTGRLLTAGPGRPHGEAVWQRGEDLGRWRAAESEAELRGSACPGRAWARGNWRRNYGARY
jgi:hypothetical protein